MDRVKTPAASPKGRRHRGRGAPPAAVAAPHRRASTTKANRPSPPVARPPAGAGSRLVLAARRPAGRCGRRSPSQAGPSNLNVQNIWRAWRYRQDAGKSPGNVDMTASRWWPGGSSSARQGLRTQARERAGRRRVAAGHVGVDGRSLIRFSCGAALIWTPNRRHGAIVRLVAAWEPEENCCYQYQLLNKPPPAKHYLTWHVVEHVLPRPSLSLNDSNHCSFSKKICSQLAYV
jgi:hypothetical protein